jgi:hypothetical protein
VKTTARSTAQADPVARGADWQGATVATVNDDGTIVTTDGIPARRMESYPSPAVGDLIHVSRSGAGNWRAEGRPATSATFVQKPTDTGHASATVTSDPHLTLPVTAGATYRVECHISAICTVDPGDINIGFSAPSGAAGWWSAFGQPSSTTSDTGTLRTLERVWTDTLVLGTLTTPPLIIRVEGLLVVGATAGTLTFQFARNMGTGTTTVRAHSWLDLHRVA